MSTRGRMDVKWSVETSGHDVVVVAGEIATAGSFLEPPQVEATT